MDTSKVIIKSKITSFFTKYIYEIAVITVIITIGLIQIPKQNRLTEQLNKEGVYIIGQLVKVEGKKGGVVVTFTFYFNGREWRDNDYKKISKRNIGAKYIVKVLPSSPNINEILPEYPVKDTLINQPDEGWTTIPKELLSTYPIVNRRFP